MTQGTITTAGRRALAAMMAVAAAGIGSGGALADTLTKSYVVPTGDVPYSAGGLADCTKASVAQGENLGQVCFGVAGLSGTVDFTISDASPLPVGASYAFYPASTAPLDPDPRTALSSGLICGSAKGIAIPAGAVHAFITVGVVNEDQAAPTSHNTSIACDKPSPGSKGTISANFSGGSATRASRSITVEGGAPVRRAVHRAYAAGAPARAHSRLRLL